MITTSVSSIQDCTLSLTSVCPEDLLVSETVSSTFARPHGLDTLQLDSGHGTLGHGGSLLQVLEDQLATRCADRSSAVGLGIVGQPTPISDTLNHLKHTQKVLQYYNHWDLVIIFVNCRSNFKHCRMRVLNMYAFICPLIG